MYLQDGYFYSPYGYQEKMINGVMCYRHNGFSPLVWRPLPCAMDRLMQHVCQLMKIRSTAHLIRALRISDSSICRHRKGTLPFQPDWLIKLHDLTGLSLKELRAIGGLDPMLPRWHHLQNYRIDTQHLCMVE